MIGDSRVLSGLSRHTACINAALPNVLQKLTGAAHTAPAHPSPLARPAALPRDAGEKRYTPGSYLPYVRKGNIKSKLLRKVCIQPPACKRKVTNS